MNPGLSSQGQGFGVQGSSEMDPGSLGQMDAGIPPAYGDSEGYGQGAFEDEPPLLKELGIDFELIKQKVSCFTACVCVCVCETVTCFCFSMKVIF